MTIGNVTFSDHSLFLAPMEGITHQSFRHICKMYGADMVYPEFVASDELVKGVERTLKKLDIADDIRPIGIQIYGHDLHNMIEATRMVSYSNPDIIDINAGCPAKKIHARGAGAGLLRNVPYLITLAQQIVKATNIPVTLKTRLGWDDNSKNIVLLVQQLQDVGIQAVTIHGRTGIQKFKGTADWTLIGEVKNNPNIKIPIIGNGDITSDESAREMFNKYGVDAIMIARGAMNSPWIFAHIKHYLNTGEQMPPLSVSQLVQLARMHFEKLIKYRGHPRGVYEMRHYFNSYFGNLDHYKDIKYRFMQTTNPAEVFELLALLNKD